MFNNLIGLGIGVIGFALIVGVGTIVLQNFGNSIGGTANTTIAYMNTQLGTSGLAGWTPAIIAFSVGMMFFGGILVYMGKGRTY